MPKTVKDRCWTLFAPDRLTIRRPDGQSSNACDQANSWRQLADRRCCRQAMSEIGIYLFIHSLIYIKKKKDSFSIIPPDFKPCIRRIAWLFIRQIRPRPMDPALLGARDNKWKYYWLKLERLQWSLNRIRKTEKLLNSKKRKLYTLMTL